MFVRSRLLPLVSSAALASLAAGLLGCGTSKDPALDKEPGPGGSAAAVLTQSAVDAPPRASDAPEAPAPLRTLTFERFAPADRSSPQKLFPIDGALVVVENERIGRVVGDSVEWTGQIPKEVPGFGRNIVDLVHGKWPDSVDVLYYNENGRAPMSTYMALTGKGKPFMLGAGGGGRLIAGIAVSGESTVVAGWTGQTHAEIVAVRGPSRGLLAKVFNLTCKADKDTPLPEGPPRPAVNPYGFGGTPAGTLMSIGPFCDRSVAAEIWGADGKSRIVDLGAWIHHDLNYPVKLLPAKGDELWLYANHKDPLLRYRDGAFAPLPPAPAPVEAAFVSPPKQLHAAAGRTIYRLDGEVWSPVAHLAWPVPLHTPMAMDEQGRMWATSGGAVQRLVDGAGVAFRDGCATPFVHLYDVKADTPASFHFPTTRKALSTFAGVAELTLVDFQAQGARRLGVKVPSKAQAEALLAHLATAMKDERPELLCFDPGDARKIDIKSGR
jgi:hypothetical protein